MSCKIIGTTGLRWKRLSGRHCSVVTSICNVICICVSFCSLICIPYQRPTSKFNYNEVPTVVNLSVLCAGLSNAWPSPVLVKLSSNLTSPLARPITEQEGSWIVSISYLAALVAYFPLCYLVDRIGRKYCIILGVLPRMIMSIVLAFASEIWMVLLGRVLSGVSDAFTFNVVPMYASEIASKEIRGSLVTILQIFVSLGVMIMLGVGPLLEYFTLNIMIFCVAMVTLVPLFFVPDSPYFLHSKGGTAEALKVLLYLRDTEGIAKDELEEYTALEKGHKINKKDLLKNINFTKATSIAIIFAAGIQLVGSNAISFYLQTILESTKTEVRSDIASGIIGFIQLLANVSTTIVTDRFGRKPILTATLVGQTIGMVGLGVFFKLKDIGTIYGFVNYVPLISLILFLFCFSAGVGSLSWCIAAELFEGRTRSIGITIYLITVVIFSFITTKYFAIVTTTIGAANTYAIFGLNCVLMCLFICYCVPETKGKSIAEIQTALGSKDEIVGHNDTIANDVKVDSSG